MPDKRIEIAIAVEQIESALDASGGDYRIDGFSNGDAELSQRAEVPGGLDGDFLAAQFHDDQRSQQFSCLIEIAFQGEALQKFDQNQVADGQEFMAEQAVGFPGFAGLRFR